MNSCVLCHEDGGQILFKNDLYRIILVNDANYPGYLRIILNSHVKELTDLSDQDSIKVYEALLICERVVRDTMLADKINIASLGNVVPHLHWHIIPRYTNDLHFPNPIWGTATNNAYVPSGELSIRSKELAVKLIEKLAD